MTSHNMWATWFGFYSALRAIYVTISHFDNNNIFRSRLKILYFTEACEAYIKQYPSSICNVIPLLAIEMLNDDACKTKFKLLLFLKFSLI